MIMFVDGTSKKKKITLGIYYDYIYIWNYIFYLFISNRF